MRKTLWKLCGRCGLDSAGAVLTELSVVVDAVEECRNKWPIRGTSVTRQQGLIYNTNTAN